MANASHEQHPSPQTLQAFAAGRLRDEQFETVESHLAHCTTCCDFLSQQPEGSLVALARAAAQQDRGTAETVALDGEAIPHELRDHPRYRVLQWLGRGGMGAVYRAEHRRMQRPVALKVVHPWLVSHPQAIERFHREVLAAAKLAHPNVVAAYDADQAGNLHFLAMEFVDGTTLDRLVAARGPLPIAEACDIVRQAAVGLQHAHELGLVHRDIKPQNLMVTTTGLVKVLDFGLTRLRDQTITPAQENAQPSPTREGAILGTPDYIAPEQIADARTADSRADIYSLGCTLYFALTGEPPFAGGTMVDKLHGHSRVGVPDPRAMRAELPAELCQILARMTSIDPGNRYANPAAVADALAGVESQLARKPSAMPASDARSGHAYLSRRNFILALSLLLILAACAAVVVWYGAGDGDARPVAAPDTNDGSKKLLLILPSRGLWYPDYRQLVAAVQHAAQRGEGDVELVVAGTTLDSVELEATSPPGQARAAMRLGPDVVSRDYAAIIFVGYDTSEFVPGGSADRETERLLAEFRRDGKPIAALCAGQKALIDNGIVSGKRIAPCRYVEPDAVTAQGGVVGSRNVERDGQLITAASDADAADLISAILQSSKP